ncbi:MAG: hypothetical protein R3C18_03820 [Planctomycetaceae bacterium]
MRLFCISLSLLLVVFAGCRKYGDVSTTTYEYAQALYGACSQQDASRLEKAEQFINDSLAGGDISEAEHGILMDIVKLAQDEQWEEATQNARQLMMEQAKS